MTHISAAMQVNGSPVDPLSKIDQLAALVSDHPTGAAFIAVFGLIALIIAYLALRALWRTARSALRGAYQAAKTPLAAVVRDRAAEDILTLAVASIATCVSAQGMWRFTGDVLGFDGPLRALLFAFIELGVLASAVRARRSMRENYSAGIDGIAVWVLACLTAVLSSLDSHSIAEAIFRLAAPLVAAWLWERGMAIERRRIRGRSSIHWRFTLERVLIYLGLAEAKDRAADEVDAQRRLTRIALAAQRARDLRQAGASERRQRRALRALKRTVAAAEGHIGLGSDESRQQHLKAQIAALYSTERLLDVEAASAWTETAPAESADPPGGVHLINQGLAQWSQEMLREPAEAVAARDRSGDQDATTPATGLATVIPAPRRRIIGAPGSPWPIGRLVPFHTWTRPEPRPLDEHFPLPPVDPTPVADADADNDRGGRVDATDSRPVADRKRPDEQDKKRAIRFYIGRAKKMQPPSKRTLADWSGFSETWALGCIQEGQRIMIAEGWAFDERGNPTPPRPVADAVASTAPSSSANGAAPVAS